MASDLNMHVHTHLHTHTLKTPHIHTFKGEDFFSPHVTHGEVPFWGAMSSVSLGYSKRPDLEGWPWPFYGKQCVYIRMNQGRWLTWKWYTCPTCFQPFCKNKQLHIRSCRVKMSRVGPSGNLADPVRRQSALTLLLSKTTLWPLSQSPHLENIKTPTRKRWK